MPTTTCHLDALLAAEKERAVTDTNKPVSVQYTNEQLRQYEAYERVRKGGRFNMFDPRARKATKLSEDEFIFVMRNYSALRKEFAPKATGAAS